MQKAPNFLKSLFTIVICYCSSRPAFIMLFALSIWASLIRIDWYWHCRICIIHYQSCFLFHCLKALTIEKAWSRKNKFFLFLNFVNCIRLASLPFIITSSCASLDTDAGFGVYQTLTVWDLEDDSWIRFLKLLSEGHPDPEIWNIDIKRMCAEIKINGIIWIFFRLQFVSNKSSIIINQFCEAFVKVGSRRRIPRDGVNIEQIKPFNANDVDDNNTNTTIEPLSLNTFQPPISNIHHIPLTKGNMSYVQRTIACAISITMFFSWNLL